MPIPPLLACGPTWEVFIPPARTMLMMAGATLAATALVLSPLLLEAAQQRKRDQRALRGRCRRCGYDVR